jgi:hypothetical protein
LKKYLDKWSLVHFAFWFAAFPGLGLFHLNELTRWFIVMLGVVIWEGVEWMLELYELIKSNEPWQNRAISDPIVSLAGALLGGYLVG